MENPFETRATEHLRDDVAFLAIVTPEPVTRFLAGPAKAGYLTDRLVVVCGTPGSGKTTLARLFEYPSLHTLLRLNSNPEFRDVRAAMEDCGAIAGGQARLLGCRLQLETDYREFWEFPYADKLKTGLMTSLLQARAVLTWLRHLRSAGVPSHYVTIIPRADAAASAEAIGGTQADEVLQRAKSVEAALYQIVGSLVPPSLDRLDEAAIGAYHPFDVIERIRVEVPGEAPVDLCPLVIFDDAHELHRDQYEGLLRWLARRELRIGRWMLTRLDVLTPYQALDIAATDQVDKYSYAGLTAGRDLIEIYLQSTGGTRRGQRRSFRKMAKDMANRYLRRIGLFTERGLSNFSNLLSVEAPPVSKSAVQQSQEATNALKHRLKISTERQAAITAQVDAYLGASQETDGSQVRYDDVRFAMIHILMHRYVKRSKGPELFPDSNPEPARPLVVDASVFDAACLHLLHNSNRPYFFGIDTICDAGSENAELFLHLAGSLVERSSMQIIQSKPGILSASTQNHLLRERAREIVDKWNFPWHVEVRRLLQHLGERCRSTTLEPNAWLAPNAFGVRQDEFDAIVENHPRLATILQFAVAYNAVSINPRYHCKGGTWCLFELTGVGILLYGLTLNRGGFLEGTLESLARVTEEKER